MSNLLRNIFVVDGTVVKIAPPHEVGGRRFQVVWISLQDHKSDETHTVPFNYRTWKTDLSGVGVGDVIRTTFVLAHAGHKGLCGYMAVCRGGQITVLRSVRAEREAEERRKAEEVGELLEELKR